MEPVIDLEEAVGSYLNCLSTGCAAGSKLYTSVGKIIDEKFHEIFHDQEPRDKYLKSSFQLLQTQNAFEGYQQALLECKEKLLEILIDSHTKRHQPNKNKQDGSTEEQYASIALRVAKELYCYHQTVADVLKPLLFSDFEEDFDNVMLTGIEGKDQIVAAWLSISEANKSLRHGYGLTNQEIGQVLSWQHGEDMSESCRKRLNQRISNLVQQYIDRLFCNAVCEVDIPTAFNTYPDELQKVLQNCCSPAESFAAASQGIPIIKEEIEVMLHRELPRVCLHLNRDVYDKASPGKAFENTTQKLQAVRDIIARVIELKKIDVTKEQIDMFCLRILAASSYSISSASSRTAVIIAFGKANLLQVKPLLTPDGEKVVYLDVDENGIEINVPSKWAIVEDSIFFKSLCRDKVTQTVATVDVSYHAVIDVADYLVKRMEPIPVARVNQCVLRQSPSNQVKKEQGRERSKSIKIKLTKATTKFFQRRSILKTDAEGDIIANEYTKEPEDDLSLDQKGSPYNTSSDSQDESQPVPPPRHKRKAKKSKKVKPDSQQKEKEKVNQEKKKEDLAWFSSSPKFGLPPLPTLSGSKDQSPSVASFEELQGVIDFLSGSSSSSLAINEKSDKNRSKTHKRNNSMTNLTSDTNNAKVMADGKQKLCHKKSASFSGNTADMTVKDGKESSLEKLKASSNQKKEEEKGFKSENSTVGENNSSENNFYANKSVSPDADFSLNVERTPGDGIDNRVVFKLAFNSTVNVNTNKVNGDKKLIPVDDINSLNKNKENSISAKTEAEDNESNNTVEIDTKLNDETRSKLESQLCVSIVDVRNESAKDHTQVLVNELAKSKPDILHTAGADKIFNISSSSMSLPNTENEPNPSLCSNIMPGASMPSSLGVMPLQRSEADVAFPDPTHKHNTVIPSPGSTVIPKGGAVGAFQTREQLLQPKQHTLYEPFNSRLSWPVGLGNKLGSLWSDATLENEGMVIAREETQHDSKQNETQFTLDKQQDFQKLLEGSKFFTAYRNGNENWKDRSYISDHRNSYDDTQLYPSPYEQSSPDPWPIHSQSRNYTPPPPNNNHNISTRNMENLQLPANPAGPYMRQNREQLLAKQQILEQYARQQKQLQLQKQAMSHQSLANQLGDNSAFNNYRLTNNSRFNVDRVASVPPGMNHLINNATSSRYDVLPDRLFLHRPLNSQRSVPSQFGNGLSGVQSRSVSDIRLDSAGMLQERIPFSQMSERNLFLDQFNQNSDLFTPQY